MAETIEQPLILPGTLANQPAGAVVATTARWLGFADDLAFGCECAYPALQIEQWRDETSASAGVSS